MVFEFCNTIPKHIFDSCDHIGSMILDRTYSYLENFVSNKESCQRFCGENTKRITFEVLKEVAKEARMNTV